MKLVRVSSVVLKVESSVVSNVVLLLMSFS